MEVYMYKSPLGDIVLTAAGGALTGLWFADRHGVPEAPGAAPEGQPSPVIAEALRWLDLYFSGKEPAFTPKLAPKGTPFQAIVWDLLLTIPYGRTVTYGDIARLAAARMGRERMSAQAAGGAVGRNPICLIIPCHRVVGADGSLTGYGEGLWRKEWLLALEKGEMKP